MLRETGAMPSRTGRKARVASSAGTQREQSRASAAASARVSRSRSRRRCATVPSARNHRQRGGRPSQSFSPRGRGVRRSHGRGFCQRSGVDSVVRIRVGAAAASSFSLSPWSAPRADAGRPRWRARRPSRTRSRRREALRGGHGLPARGVAAPGARALREEGGEGRALSFDASCASARTGRPRRSSSAPRRRSRAASRRTSRTALPAAAQALLVGQGGSPQVARLK